MPPRRRPFDSHDIDALAHLLPGKVIIDGHHTAAVSTDLGRILTHRPRALVRPTCTDGGVTTVRFCVEQRVPLAVRGAAHTTFEQTLSEGVVLDLSALPAQRLCRYMARPPIPRDRLAWREAFFFLASTWRPSRR